MNGSVDNVTTELGGRITFRCNDGFLPSQVMTAVCQTTGWSQDPTLLECFPQGTLYMTLCFIDNCNICIASHTLEFNSGRQDTGIAIGVIAVPVAVGTAVIFTIIFVVVASIWIYVGRTKQKCMLLFQITVKLLLVPTCFSKITPLGQKSTHTLENIR